MKTTKKKTKDKEVDKKPFPVIIRHANVEGMQEFLIGKPHYDFTEDLYFHWK